MPTKLSPWGYKTLSEMTHRYVTMTVITVLVRSHEQYRDGRVSTSNILSNSLAITYDVIGVRPKHPIFCRKRQGFLTSVRKVFDSAIWEITASVHFEYISIFTGNFRGFVS